MRSLSRPLDGETRSVNIPPHSDKQQRKAYESRREREFYSYYESVLALADTAPPLCDLNDPASVAAHRPRSSNDKALTAFVQLTALRLQSRRSMLFFFDSDYAYILAEATRTLSLLDDREHEIDDSLWLGATRIPRGHSVCEVTADLPANHGSNADDPDTKSIAHIIDDLRGDVRFCNRAYVTGGPRARFYAGVPVTTKHGINIGALCVLDDKPRDGLSPADTRFLCDMATTVMTHLSMVRANTENQRSGDMTTALSAFIEGKSKSNDWLHRTAHHTANEPSHGLADPQHTQRTYRSRMRPTYRKGRPLVQKPSKADMADPPTRSGSDNSASSQIKPTKREQYSQSSASTAPESSSSDSPSTSNSKALHNELATQSIDIADFASQPAVVDSSKGLQEDRFTTHVKTIMNRAAGLIREAVDVDGVLFLDATIGSYEGQVSSVQAVIETDSALTDTTGETRSAESAMRPSSTENVHHTRRRGCPVLGAAGGSDSDEEGSSTSSMRISESFLRSLLRRYPDGRVWHFNPDGEASSDDLPGTTLSQDSTGESNGSETETATDTPADWRSRKRLHARIRDGRMLQRLFPGVRSFLMVGMWDTSNERWYGASMIWSYSPIRILRASTDLTFVAAFCDVVMAEIARAEAQSVDRSKNDFISSISHELRSPLHGILGSAECLEERENDPVGQELVRSVLSCGTTLLEIINQLLQYSKLDNGAQQRHTRLRQFGNSMKASKASILEEGVSGVATPEAEIMLSRLTEEAIDAACAGFEHQGLTTWQKEATHHSRDRDGTDARPSVIVDIEDAFDPSWALHVTTGSWKRICMNLVSNSLKYTPRGRVVVTLRKKMPDGESQLTEVILSVEDTGIGMSESFQANNLFRPFKQENIHAQGTGLGLNLVAKLAKVEGGKVVVKSQKGVGTTVTFTSRLMAATNIDVVSQGLNMPYQGVTYDMLGFASPDEEDKATAQCESGDRKLADVLRAMCHQLGMKLGPASDAPTGTPTLHLVHESVLERSDSMEGEALFQSRRELSVVVCANRASALRLRKDPRHRPSTGWTHQFIWQPVGPTKLASAIAGCLSTIVPSSTGPAFDDDPRLTTTEAVAGAANVVASDVAASRSSALHTAEVALRSRIDDAEQIDTRPLLEHSTQDENGTNGARHDEVINIASPQRSLSLLLVDDNHVNLRLLAVFAQKSGYHYEMAKDGQEAVDIYKRSTRAPGAGETDTIANRQPDVVLMDLNMPVLDGFAATKQIRQFEKESGVPKAKIIALTGLGNKQAQDRSFECGTDLFLTKPVRLKELGAILSKLGKGDEE
nr:hypothetical protein B0A51_11866 [Rachicladosporium sp. CCFEE 5018]